MKPAFKLTIRMNDTGFNLKPRYQFRSYGSYVAWLWFCVNLEMWMSRTWKK